MGFAFPLALTLALSNVVDARQPSNGRYELEALVTKYDAILKDVDSEIVNLLVQQTEVDRSTELRREEAQSLRTRFPRVAVLDTFTVDQFIAALYDERQRVLREQSDTLWAIEDSLRQSTCAELAELTRTTNKLAQSPDWAKLTLEERSAVRTVVVESRRLAWTYGDPCLPAARPTISESMVDE